MSNSKRTLFEVNGLEKWYRQETGKLSSRLWGEPEYLKAVDGVDFDIKSGEILGLAGQSGCGKSTIGDLLLRLQEPTEGTISFKGDNISEYGRKEMKEFRQQCQVIFQDPYESLNPRFPVARYVSEPLQIHNIGTREERDARTMKALEDAGLTPPEQFLSQLPSELSGGERQRVAIARALVLNPQFIVADEPVSMLDVSIRTSILHLFEKLREERDLSLLYISHNLETIKYLTDRTMIMYMGKIVENGPTERVIYDHAHPYTEALLDAAPDPNPESEDIKNRLGGEVPDPVDLPEGCRFHPRCPYSSEECRESEPPIDELVMDSGEEEHLAACFNPVNR